MVDLISICQIVSQRISQSLPKAATEMDRGNKWNEIKVKQQTAAKVMRIVTQGHQEEDLQPQGFQCLVSEAHTQEKPTQVVSRLALWLVLWLAL